MFWRILWLRKVYYSGKKEKVKEGRHNWMWPICLPIGRIYCHAHLPIAYMRFCLDSMVWSRSPPEKVAFVVSIRSFLLLLTSNWHLSCLLFYSIFLLEPMALLSILPGKSNLETETWVATPVANRKALDFCKKKEEFRHELQIPREKKILLRVKNDSKDVAAESLRNGSIILAFYQSIFPWMIL